MMMLPEEFYEYYLKGRSVPEIGSVIRGLRIRMGRLKSTMEDPDYNRYIHMCPGEDVQLLCCREYLEEARRAYAGAGGVYRPSRAELRAERFEADIPFITKMTCSYAAVGGDTETRVITLTEDVPKLFINDPLFLSPAEYKNTDDEPLTREQLLEEVRGLHLGEWRRVYDIKRFGPELPGGKRWRAEIEFGNGRKPFTAGGNCLYPYNFRAFEELFGVDDTLCPLPGLDSAEELSPSP